MKTLNQLYQFPEDITFAEFEEIPDLRIKQDIAKKNRLLMSDTYNRTMSGIKEHIGTIDNEGIMTLTLRRAANGQYNTIMGVRQKIEELFGRPITWAEFNFARDFAKSQEQVGGVTAFPEQLWKSVLEDHGGYIPLTIEAVEDGTNLLANEVTLKLKGNIELAAWFEPVLTRIFLATGVATKGNTIRQTGIKNIVDNANRSVPNDDYMFEAIQGQIVGYGLEATSHDQSAAIFGLKSSGTTAHRFYAEFENEMDAMRAAASEGKPMVILTDLIDTASGIKKITQLRKEKPEQVIGYRLDSGGMEKGVELVQQNITENNLTLANSKIIASEIGSLDALKAVDKTAQDLGIDPELSIGYGIGAYLMTKDISRDAVSGVLKLTQAPWGATGKLSSDIGKMAIPGDLNIEIRDNERVMVQDYEPVLGKRLLKPVYKNGNVLYEGAYSMSYLKECQERAHDMADILKPGRLSDETKRIQKQVFDHFMAQKI